MLYEDRERDVDFRFEVDADLFFGTLAPFERASLSPMAIACFRLFTFAPLLLFSVPAFRRCIADLTRFWAAFPYFATLPPLLGELRESRY